jgi:hypothetical protein
MTSRQTDSLIHHIAVQIPSASSSYISLQLPSQVSVSTRTIHHHLQVDFKLHAYHPACAPLLSKKNIKDQLAFAHKYLE